jgi:hypothetical protein
MLNKKRPLPKIGSGCFLFLNAVSSDAAIDQPASESGSG